MTACEDHAPLFAVVDAMLSNMAQPAWLRVTGSSPACFRGPAPERPNPVRLTLVAVWAGRISGLSDGSTAVRCRGRQGQRIAVRLDASCRPPAVTSVESSPDAAPAQARFGREAGGVRASSTADTKSRKAVATSSAHQVRHRMRLLSPLLPWLRSSVAPGPDRVEDPRSAPEPMQRALAGSRVSRIDDKPSLQPSRPIWSQHVSNVG